MTIPKISKENVYEVKPNHEQISVEAYKIYELSGCKDGCCEENWLKAESKLQKTSK